MAPLVPATRPASRRRRAAGRTRRCAGEVEAAVGEQERRAPRRRPTRARPGAARGRRRRRCRSGLAGRRGTVRPRVAGSPGGRHAESNLRDAVSRRRCDRRHRGRRPTRRSSVSGVTIPSHSPRRPAVLARLAGFTVRRRRRVLLARRSSPSSSPAPSAAASPTGCPPAASRTPTPSRRSVEDVLARRVRHRHARTSSCSSRPATATSTTPAVAAAGRALAAELGAETFDGVRHDRGHLLLGRCRRATRSRSDGGDKALVLGRFPDDDDVLVDALRGSRPSDYTRDDPAVADHRRASAGSARCSPRSTRRSRPTSCGPS